MCHISANPIFCDNLLSHVVACTRYVFYNVIHAMHCVDKLGELASAVSLHKHSVSNWQILQFLDNAVYWILSMFHLRCTLDQSVTCVCIYAMFSKVR